MLEQIVGLGVGSVKKYWGALQLNTIRSTLTLPASSSLAHRGMTAQSISDETVRIWNFGLTCVA